MEGYSLQFSSSHGAGLLAGFQRLRADGRMCDVVLEAGGGAFPCHRPLLAASSEYFRALFGESAAERWADMVRLPALTAEGLGAVLDFLYGGWLSLSPAALPAVLEASRYLQIDAAVAICQRFITDGLSARTCCCYANLAERHALPDALAAANRTVATEMEALLREDRDGLLGLNVQSLTAVLEAEEMPGVQEAELVGLCLDWLDANGPIPLLRSNLLLSRLRFGLVAAEGLASLSHSPHRAMATPLIRSQVTRALEYHWLGDARPIRQSRQSSVRASANHVLLVGGGASSDWPERRVLTLDLRNRRCSFLTSRLPVRLKDHCVCSVGGFLFLIGGDQVTGGGDDEDEDGGGKCVASTTSKQVWRYDPRFDRWDEVASMRERRARFTCCVVGGVIYVFGGRHEEADSPGASNALASVEFYHMEGGAGGVTAWRRGAPMPRPLHGHASAVLGGRVYVSGGSPGGNHHHQGGPEITGSRELVCWDPGSATGGGGGPWEKRAPMAIGRFGHRLAEARGHLYALLGVYEPFCDIERYDPAADAWTRLRPLPAGGSFGYGMASTPAGTLLLCGGRRWSRGREVTLRSVMEYEPERDRWREMCQLPEPLTGTECSLMALPL